MECERCWNETKTLYILNNGDYQVCEDCLHEEDAQQCEMCNEWFTEDAGEYVEGMADINNGWCCYSCIEDSR